MSVTWMIFGCRRWLIRIIVYIRSRANHSFLMNVGLRVLISSATTTNAPCPHWTIIRHNIDVWPASVSRARWSETLWILLIVRMTLHFVVLNTSIRLNCWYLLYNYRTISLDLPSALGTVFRLRTIDIVVDIWGPHDNWRVVTDHNMHLVVLSRSANLQGLLLVTLCCRFRHILLCIAYIVRGLLLPFIFSLVLVHSCWSLRWGALQLFRVRYLRLVDNRARTWVRLMDRILIS